MSYDDAAGTEPVTHAPALPARPLDGHKGTFGTVAVVGGSYEDGLVMAGAPALAALGALRAGAGLARLAVPEPIVAACLSLAPSATAIAMPVREHEGVVQLVPHLATQAVDRAASAEAVVIGPGLGTGAGAQSAVLRAIVQRTAHVIADADAINVLAMINGLGQDLRASVVLTPHPGEFKRLAEALRVSHQLHTAGGRLEAAAGLARRLGCVVVLKGRGTVVTDGLRSYVCQGGGPWLATAGTGDVLAGVIAGIVAQHVLAAPRADLYTLASMRSGRTAPVSPDRPLDLFQAACAGVSAHAAAADAWRARSGCTGGMLATDLLAEIPAAVESMRRAEPA